MVPRTLNNYVKLLCHSDGLSFNGNSVKYNCVLKELLNA